MAVPLHQQLRAAHSTASTRATRIPTPTPGTHRERKAPNTIPPRIRRGPTNGKQATGDAADSANPLRSLKPRKEAPPPQTHEEKPSFSPSHRVPSPTRETGGRVFPQIPNSLAKVGCLSSQLPFACLQACRDADSSGSLERQGPPQASSSVHLSKDFSVCAPTAKRKQPSTPHDPVPLSTQLAPLFILPSVHSGHVYCTTTVPGAVLPWGCRPSRGLGGEQESVRKERPQRLEAGSLVRSGLNEGQGEEKGALAHFQPPSFACTDLHELTPLEGRSTPKHKVQLFHNPQGRTSPRSATVSAR
ncbi:hypothetical protein Cadr_000029121 [Camelus dromedarius]|uniref:Uncharacterized protein n=1 Tax=Camelus dromedarius TaxID=9838 RepID=A0A5N4C6X1_CAMDR|nr:hypothetical protein Cadr_000029121 [Camelus dromedarius]